MLPIAIALRGSEKVDLDKAKPYLDWLRHGGAEPLIVSPAEPALPPSAAGLLLTGGEDLDPSLYGEKPLHAERVDRRRDQAELALVEAARRRHIPLLGVCRGTQALAVALGGSLVQDIGKLVGGAIAHRGTDPDRGDTEHDVTVASDSLLARVLGETRTRVNSHHHQAVREVPPPARIVARADDGVAEALEIEGGPFAVAVQWHPERWPRPSSAVLRDAFLAAARRG